MASIVINNNGAHMGVRPRTRQQAGRKQSAGRQSHGVAAAEANSSGRTASKQPVIRPASARAEQQAVRPGGPAGRRPAAGAPAGQLVSQGRQPG